MKAVTWQGVHDMQVTEVPDPRIEEPTDAVIKVTSTALCGSDLHLYETLAPFMEAGDVVGHEPMGIVQEVGSGVTELAVGDRVVVPFNVCCGSCWMCERHLYSQCETTQNHEHGTGASFFGYSKLYGQVPGGQAEYLRVPFADFLPVKLPEEHDDDRFLFLSDVLPTAWQALKYADVPDDGTLLVLGAGPIGDMASRMAVRAGHRVITVDRVPERLARVKAFGAEVLDLDEAEKVGDVGEIVRESTGGRGPDAVIDAVGMEASGSKADTALTVTKVQMDRTHALREAMASVRRGGTLSVIGVYGGPVQMFPMGDLFDMQVQLRMGQANVLRWIPEILPLLDGDDPLGVDDLITHRLPLDKAADAYEMFRDKTDGCIKVVLDPAA